MSTSGNATGSDRTAQYWSDAVEELRDIQFTSIDEAVDRVIDAVLARIHIEAGSQEEAREFLRCAFETDPEFESVLRQYLII